MGCKSVEDIINAGGRVINNPNGTISIFTISPITGMLAPYHINRWCCEKLDVAGVYFDVNKQQCRWSTEGNDDCNYNAPFNLVLNPKGNDGAIFSINPDEVCTLDVDFDYLFKFNCEELANLIRGTVTGSCATSIDVFESLAATMTIDVVDVVLGNTVLTKVYEEEFFPKIGSGNLYKYLSGASADTGFYVCGTTGLTDTVCQPLNVYETSNINCAMFDNQILDLLFQESGLPTSGLTEFRQNISEDAFASNWLHFDTSITDQTIISAITNEKIKLTVKLSGTCIDGCLLLDNIKLNKNSTKTLRNDIFVSKSPSFELDRIRDNKKSWVANTETTHREFNITKPDGTQPIRFTDYHLDDERQIINTKELDLDINIASAVETDVWCYISDNACILSGLAGCVVYSSVTTYSSTTTSGITSGYTCSDSGYNATPNHDCCRLESSVAASSATTGEVIIAGNKATSYGSSGAYFYPNANGYANPAYPLHFFASGGTTLYNQTGGTITPTAFNSASAFWASLGSTLNGRLNNAGISGGTGTSLTNRYGVSHTFSAATGGTYYIGFAAKSNGITINLNQSTTPLFSSDTSVTTAIYNEWHVLEVNLCSGVNIIEGSFYAAHSDFALEVYQPISFSALTGATSSGSSQANVIFSTLDRIGTTFDLGTTGGYSCPSGYVVNTSGAQPCTSILKSASGPTYSTGVTSSSTITIISGITGTTTTSTQCCDPSYIESVTATTSGHVYSCPVGYSATPANDACQLIATTAATFNGSGSTIVRGDAGANYGKFGTYFYPNIQNNEALPVYYKIADANLYNQSGGTIPSTAIVNSGNPFWFNSGNATDGRLNAAGISASTTEYLGFTQCIDVLSGGTYYVGLAADNFCRFKVNGLLMVNLTGSSTINFNFWSVFAVELTSGLNIIEMEGMNATVGPTAFAAEIYKPIDLPTLTGSTSSGSSQANIIFSTLDRVGTFFDLGTTIGYSCPSGYTLDTCGAPVCTLIMTTGVTASATNITTVSTIGCCSGSCGDGGSVSINDLLTQPLSAVTTIEDFKYYITSELIDAKSRKTISSYPTTRLLYDRYMNSTGFCATNSSRFDYTSMNKFAGLIGNYWVDIIEQVVPATTIWGATRIYTNTIFDTQKYKYKGYSTLFGDNTFAGIDVLSPSSGTSVSATVTTTVIQGGTTGTTLLTQGNEQTYNNLYLVQMNNGSEFLGSVNIVGPSGGNNVINETF